MFVSDVISIEKTSENFRLVYDVKGRFAVHRITPDEASVSYGLSFVESIPNERICSTIVWTLANFKKKKNLYVDALFWQIPLHL